LPLGTVTLNDLSTQKDETYDYRVIGRDEVGRQSGHSEIITLPAE
jgi:hypothetical protein